MKRSIYVLILALAACGSPHVTPVVPSVPSPATLVDIATLLFSTPCRDIGGGTILCDSIDANGRITRKTYTPGNHFGLAGEEIETWSIYQIDATRGCIAVVQEETRLRAGGVMQALQTYFDESGAAPCWVSALNAQAPLTLNTAGEYSYLWVRFDAAGNPVGDQVQGRYSDSTKLELASPVSTLTERYEDFKDMTSVYCGVGTYGDSGMITVRQDPKACQ